MIVIDRFESRDASSRQLASNRRRHRPSEACCADIPVEHSFEAYIDGVLSMRAVCTPDSLVELVVGRLFTEGVISGIADIARIEVDERGETVLVSLNGTCAPPVGIDAVGTCFSGRLSTPWACGAPGSVKPLAWSEEEVFSLARRFAEDSPGHRRTFGLHSCYLATGGSFFHCSEDLGRHNAFDKAIGHALIGGVDLSKVTVFTSGRVPVDMISKAVRAGVPIMVSKAVPTDRAVAIARASGMTLICSAHADAVRVFSDPIGEKNRSEAV